MLIFHLCFVFLRPCSWKIVKISKKSWCSLIFGSCRIRDSFIGILSDPVCTHTVVTVFSFQFHLFWQLVIEFNNQTNSCKFGFEIFHRYPIRRHPACSSYIVLSIGIAHQNLFAVPAHINDWNVMIWKERY